MVLFSPPEVVPVALIAVRGGASLLLLVMMINARIIGDDGKV